MSSVPLHILKSLVDQIQAQPFVRQQRTRGLLQPSAAAPIVTGWDQRLLEYAYAKRNTPSLHDVYSFRSTIRQALTNAVRSVPNWHAITNPSHLPPGVDVLLQSEAARIFSWGGLRAVPFTDTWKVVKSAILGAQVHAAPMSSGWTKVASFATDHTTLPQTIWDSRVSTSIVHRLDAILVDAGTTPGSPAPYRDVMIVPGRGGSRPRPTHLDWNTAYPYRHWKAHFEGSEIVRDIVKILNTPGGGYPRVPVIQDGNNGWTICGVKSPKASDWDVFSVGLVLFMDGY